MLPSAATSVLFLLCGTLSAQEPVRPPSALPSEQKSQAQPPQQPPLITDKQAQQLLEDEGKYTPPSKEELYRVDSESTKFERLKQIRKIMNRPDIDFPDEDTIRIRTSLEARKFGSMQATQVASYVVYQPLYFQQINHERYGWELGVFQPLVSTGQFYADVLMFPYKFAANPPWHCDANVGYALPGDPEQLRFLTPPFSWRGVVGQTGAMIGGAAIFP